MDPTVEVATYPGLDDRIIILRAGDAVDAVFIRTARYNVLVDTLATPALCRQALGLLAEHMAARPLLVINSHMDWYHFWGNATLDRGVPIIAHATASDRFRQPAARETFEEKKRERRFLDVEIFAPTMTFTGEIMTVHGGDLSLELIHTPGTPLTTSPSGSRNCAPAWLSTLSNSRFPKSGAAILPTCAPCVLR